MNWVFVFIMGALIFIPNLSNANEDTSGNSKVESAGEEVKEPERQGYLISKYTQRSTRTNQQYFQDQDVFGQLSLDTLIFNDKHYKFHFLGSGNLDLDGEQETKYFNPFEDIYDTRNSREFGYIYEFYLDLNQLHPKFENIRLGRQFGTRDEAVFFDGAQVDLNLTSQFKGSFFGGRTVHFNESKPGDDTVKGTGFDFFPRNTSKISVDYLAIRDERPSKQNDQDELVALRYWHRFSTTSKGMTKLRWLNGEPRDFTAHMIISFLEDDFYLNANYFRQLLILEDLVDEFTPYFNILGKSFPYHSASLNLRKFLGEHYAIDIGLFQRKLINKRDDSEFNRDFGRYYIALEIFDLIMKNLSFTITGEIWDGLKKMNSSGLEVRYWLQERGKGGHFDLGTYYSLFKYEAADYTFREVYDVRTYFIRGVAPIIQNVSLNGSFEKEASREDYNVLKAGVRYDF